MNDDLLNVLKNAIEKYGRETVLPDPKRVSAFFADLARDVPKPQKNTFIKCLEYGFVQPLQNVSEAGREDCKRKLAQRLHDEEGLDLRLCGEALELLAEVLFQGQEEEKEKHCKNCGEELQERWMYCPICSTPVAGQEGAAPIKSSVPKPPPTQLAARGGQLVRTLKGHTNAVLSVAVSPNGKYIVSGSADWSVILWEAESGRRIHDYIGHGQGLINFLTSRVGGVNSVAFSPDGKYIVSGSDDLTLKVWDHKTKELNSTAKGHKMSVSSVAFSPDGKYIVSGSFDQTLKMWNNKLMYLIRTIEASSQADWVCAISITVSPDSRNIVSGSGDGTLKLWEAANGQLIYTLKGHKDAVNSLAFSPDGNYIVSGSRDKTLKLWNALDGRLIHTMEGHKYWINSVAFSPNGKHIVSGSVDKTLMLWEAKGACQPISTIKGHKGIVSSVAFSPDGKYIVSGSEDKTLKIWAV